MLPTFGDDRRRPINLGGASSVVTQAAILQEVKARRLERQDVKQRQEKAIRLQAWWRGIRDARAARQEMRQMFYGNVTNITGLRCLVFIGRDEEILGRWSTTMNSYGEVTLFEPATGSHRKSWTVLIRKTSIMLLKSIAEYPQSPHAVAHLNILHRLLSLSAATRVLGPSGLEICCDLTDYLMNQGLHSYLARAILAIPMASKSSPSLPCLISLITEPFSTFLENSRDNYRRCLEETISTILTIPLLLNRLPLPVLTELSSRLPFSALEVISPETPRLVSSLTIESKIHLIANLTTFIAPRYSKISDTTFIAYLRLLTALLDALPPNSLDPPEEGVPKDSGASWRMDDSDSESESNRPMESLVSFPFQPLPPLDIRTRRRLQSLPSAAHINSLLNASHSRPTTVMALVSFLLALDINWPARKTEVLSTVGMYTCGGFVRELYRSYVRSSPLGNDDSPGSLIDSTYASYWPPILFVADLYTQSLLTMGDDEFFSSATSPTAPLNPLSLDEVASLSRRLLNIAFALYFREDQTNIQEGGVPGVNIKWEGAREKLNRCLLSIHARDSRKPFTPPGHWLVTSQIDMQSFVEAAIFEEQQISAPVESRPLTKRQISYLSPRLGVLNNIPFSIPFETRVSIFRHFVANDMLSQGRSRHDFFGGRKKRVQVRRGNVAEDGFDKLGDVDLKAQIEITFVDQFGQEEAGIDGGGLFKEFFTSLCKEVFDTDRGLWLATPKNELYPNPHPYAIESHSLNWYRFIGRILGKALYEGILVDVAFAGFFLAKWLDRQSFLDDLVSLDPDLYQGLIFLKHYTEDPEELSLNFTVAVEEFGTAKALDLIPNGSNVAVTRENRLQYIHLVSHYRLSKQIKYQSDAFFEGLSEMIDPKWLRMFNQQEVQILLGGVNAPVDLDDLRAHTSYGGTYNDDDPTITYFWNVANTFDHAQRRALLRFVTSCSRPPLLGFKELIPHFAIRASGPDEHRLPTSSTCVNLLKLPQYQSEKILREKLLQAITSNAGFDLS